MVKSNKVKSFWIVFFGVTAALAIAACVTLGVFAEQEKSLMRMSVVSDENAYKISEENGYKQSLYLACDSLKNLDANLGKAAVSSNPSTQAKLLTNAVVCAESVNRQLGNLPIRQSDNLNSCQRFVNQTQDYSVYLISKLASGNKLASDERSALRNLDEVAKNMYDFLQTYAQSDSAMFITNGNGIDGVGSLSDSLNDVDDKAFAYEKLIYDGPFSESTEQKTLPCDGKISVEQASAKVSEIFGENSLSAKMRSKEGYLYAFNTQNGTVTLTCDGYVIQFEGYAEPHGGTVSKEDCISKAEDFCGKLGYDVKGVWVSKTQDDVTYVNCAPVIDGVIVYPKLIKVAVSSDGEIAGLEAKAYLLNRNQKVDAAQFGSVSEQDARSVLLDGMTVTNVTKAYIQRDSEDYFCWEFECQIGNDQYYVYVDSVSGVEMQIFKVIQNTEGHTVI